MYTDECSKAVNAQKYISWRLSLRKDVTEALRSYFRHRAGCVVGEGSLLIAAIRLGGSGSAPGEQIGT